MKSKPRINKRDGSWVVTREAFGFAQSPVTTERRTHTAAIRSLGEINVGFASAERAATPEHDWAEIWPVVVR